MVGRFTVGGGSRANLSSNPLQEFSNSTRAAGGLAPARKHLPLRRR